MSGLHQALALQGLLEEVGERIKDNVRGRSYLSPDGRAYVLAVGGEDAKAMADFMRAVGEYLTKAEDDPEDRQTAKEKLLRAFDDWLSKQSL